MNRFSRIVFFVVLVFGIPQWTAQAASDPEIVTLARKRAGLERRALFLDAWTLADAAAQNRARRVLRVERDGADRIAAMPSVESLTLAWRVLTDENANPVETDLLRDFAESLDLRVVPGIYEGKPEGLPQALTVRVSSIYSVKLEHIVRVALIWIGEDGKEIRARSEPVAPKAFARGGFDMYVRAPSPVPGAWKLVCEVTQGTTSGRGVPISVIGLDQPAALLSSEDSQTRTEFELLQEHGVRPTFFRAFLELMGALPADAGADWVGARSDNIDHETFRSLEENGHHTWSVGANWVADPKCILVLLKPEEEAPEAALVGAVGHEWQLAARENSWWVLSTDLPLRSDEGASLLTLAGQLREWKPDAQLVLVGRGSALLELQMAQLHRPDWVFDRMALSTVLSPNVRPKNLPDFRGLFVSSDAATPGQEVVSTEGKQDWTWKKRTDPLVVTDLALPKLISEWLSLD